MENKNRAFMDRIPVPACIVAPDGTIKAANTLIKQVFAYEDIVSSKFFVLAGVRRKDLIEAADDDAKKEFLIQRNSRIFILETNTHPEEEEDLLVYFIDVTDRESYKHRYQEERLCVMYLLIDNYDEMMSGITTDSRRAIPTEVDRIIRAWADKIDAVIEAISDEEYLMIVQRKDAERVIEGKFSVLDDIRRIDMKVDFPVSLSIGMGMGAATLRETADLAKSALELAMGRGGDQAVVKNGEHTSYYGGKLQSLEKNNKGKSRVIAHALRQQILDSKRVLIMGHRWPDMDSFGAALGVFRICRYMAKDAHIVIEEYNETLQVIFRQAKASEDYSFINRDRAIELCDENTLIVVVDTNRPWLAECPEILKISQRVVMIDHHRLAEDSISNPILSYVESYASSACELMTEIIQYTGPRRIINKFEAEALLAGITVDTNSYSIRTGVRTFEAAAWLRRAGADTTEVKRFFQSEALAFQTRADAIANAEYLDNGAVIAISRGYSTEAQIINAQVADELLMVKGVEAAFAVGQNDRHMTVVSARSLGRINVQTIMEKFGGGGHLTSAGARVEQSPEEVIEQLRKILAQNTQKSAE